MSDGILQGTIHSIQTSDGGVPKHPVGRVEVTVTGLVGDRQRDLRHHGGPERAVSLLGLDVIDRLVGEGHPIRPGSTGENVTLADVDWSRVPLGSRFRFEHGVELEALSFALPCGNVKASFKDGAIKRIHHERHPGESRIYARVLEPGHIREGEAVEVIPPARG